MDILFFYSFIFVLLYSKRYEKVLMLPFIFYKKHNKP